MCWSFYITMPWICLVYFFWFRSDWVRSESFFLLYCVSFSNFTCFIVFIFKFIIIISFLGNSRRDLLRARDPWTMDLVYQTSLCCTIWYWGKIFYYQAIISYDFTLLMLVWGIFLLLDLNFLRGLENLRFFWKYFCSNFTIQCVFLDT